MKKLAIIMAIIALSIAATAAQAGPPVTSRSFDGVYKITEIGSDRAYGSCAQPLHSIPHRTFVTLVRDGVFEFPGGKAPIKRIVVWGANYTYLATAFGGYRVTYHFTFTLPLGAIGHTFVQGTEKEAGPYSQPGCSIKGLFRFQGYRTLKTP